MMKELLKKLQKKSNKKGFTLVEIIDVLVILAILAAIAVPSVLGYVNEAKDERYIQEARSIYVVIQTEEAKAKALDEDPVWSSVATKAKDMTDLPEVTSISKSGDVYTVKWTSDDNKKKEATITKNKDVKVKNQVSSGD